jgi:hypothetical protein
VDSADITLYIGHGAPNCITFTATPNLFYNNARLPHSWGDDAATNYNKAVWLGFLSCSVMQWDWIDAAAVHHTCVQRWSPAFDGLHTMLGFKSPAWAGTGFPGTFANRMLGCPNQPMSIFTAWFSAAAAHGTGTPAAMGPLGWVWVTTPAPAHWALVSDLGDYYWGKGPVGPTFRWWQIVGWWYL